MNAADPHDLARFVAAQNPVWQSVVAELRDGRKRTHWMWYVFPQIAGLGSSPMAARYAIGSRQEAAAYLDHPVLGARLVEATRLVLGVQGSSLRAIFGTPDDLKFRSCMTLFAMVDPDQLALRDGLRMCGGPDAATLARLNP